MATEDTQPATKSDIAHLDQKFNRLDQKVDRIASAVVKLQSEVVEIKQTMSTKDDINRILNAIDAFAGKTQNYDRASVLHGRALVEIEVKVQDHEKRLKSLETK